MRKSDRSEMTKNPEIELLILENRRLQKIIDALIEHAEKPVDTANSAFGLFQATVLLEDQVRSRTAELETALHKNELISRELQLSKEQIEKKETILKNIVEYAPIGMSIIDINQRYTLVNQAFCNIVGYDRDELYAMTPFDLIHPDDKNKSLHPLNQIWDYKDNGCPIEKRYLRKNGEDVWVSLTYSTVFDSNGIPLLYIGQVEDITQRKQAQEKLHLAAKVFSTSNEAIMITDHQNKIVSVNNAFIKLTGYTLEEVIGKDPKLLSSNKHDTNFFNKFWNTIQSYGGWEGEIWNHKKNGELYVERLSISTVHSQDGKIQNYIALFADITEERKANDQIWNHANFDPITQLPNRHLFFDRLEQAILHSIRSGKPLALMFIDLDHFKEVNDTMGHQVGDQLLVIAAEQISAKVRESDTVARLGGDEFTVIFPDMQNAKVIAKIASEINEALSQVFEIGQFKIQISASIGVAFHPQDATEQSQLIDCADKAMYLSKQQGRNRFNLFENIDSFDFSANS